MNVYRKADREVAQGRTGQVSTMPASIDILCAELLETELREKLVAERDFYRLGALSSHALQRNGPRTQQAVGDIITSKKWTEEEEPGQRTVAATLSVQEHTLIQRAKQGEHRVIWEQRRPILKLLRTQKSQGNLRLAVREEWRLDAVLLKALIATCANTHASKRRTRFARLKLSVGGVQLLRGVKMLYSEVQEIYDEVSDAWVTRFLIALARGVEPGVFGRRASLTLQAYLDLLPLVNYAQLLFKRHCDRSSQRGALPPARMIQAMLDLELNLVLHSKRLGSDQWKGSIARGAKARADTIEHIINLLALREKQEEQEVLDHSVRPGAGTVMSRLQSMAKATHTYVKAQLMRGDWVLALSSLHGLLGRIEPDERYMVFFKDAPSEQDRCMLTARAMMSTRRLMRASFISTAVFLDDCPWEERQKGVVRLAELTRDSIERGLWDAWPLEGSRNNELHKPHNLRMQPIHPPDHLSSLFSRLLGMSRPVCPRKPNSVAAGYMAIQNGVSASTYWSVMECLSQSGTALQKRTALLREEELPASEEQALASLRTIFTRRGSSGAQCIWSLLAAAPDCATIMSRLQLLLHGVFVPFAVPRRGWTSARLALDQVLQSEEQRWPLDVDTDPFKTQLQSHFDDAHSSMPSLDAVESAGVPASQSRLARRNRRLRASQQRQRVGAAM